MDTTNINFVLLVAAMICAALISFTSTPIARVLAFRMGALDVPRDNRRMHRTPIPRMGGLAVFFAFCVASAVFCEYNDTLLSIWFGGLLIVVLGMLDDTLNLNAWLKLVMQIVIALIPVSQGIVIDRIMIFGRYINFGAFAIPVTVFWIVALVNAINLIDGLDGLCSGIAAICSMSMLLVSIVLADNPASTAMTAVLAGSCLGFLPYNTNPAKIFLGDTGALFLGYSMAVLSIDGLFKLHAVLSFVIPVSIFGLPLFDTAFAFARRIAHGKSPFSADRGHIHHRLIDMGFNQKQTVGILYAICGILGISAVLFTIENLWKAAIVILVGFGIFIVDYFIVKNPKTRHQAGLGLPGDVDGEEGPQVDDTPTPEERLADEQSADTAHRGDQAVTDSHDSDRKGD